MEKQFKVGKLFLMNSSILTSEGTYYYRLLTPDEAKKVYDTAKEEGRKIVSAIGYTSTAEYMMEILDDYVEVARDQINMEAGDMALICKLGYRVADPKLKHNFTPKPDDFEWALLVKVK